MAIFSPVLLIVGTYYGEVSFIQTDVEFPSNESDTVLNLIGMHRE